MKCGDEVRIYYNYREMGDVEQRATLIHKPMGAGDMWGFALEDGTEFYLNPYHYSLRKIEVLCKSEAEEP